MIVLIIIIFLCGVVPVSLISIVLNTILGMPMELGAIIGVVVVALWFYHEMRR